MDPTVNEWLNLIIRWVHIVVAIAWIGHSFFFMWLDSNLTPPEEGEAREGVQGELWMVHSGGFYRVEKKKVVPDRMPKTLHWFKWEAAATWLSGFLLLSVVYYMGGLLVDTGVSTLSVGAAAAIGLGLLPAAWIVYDSLWRSPLGKVKKVAAVISVALVLGIALGLTRVLSGRAAYIHVGAMLGTLMVANVWLRILPAQRQLIAATREGKKADADLAAQAKMRSIHNNYMTFPLIFIMISNHFPTTTYGYHWLMLGALMTAGAGVRHFMNVGGRSGALAAIVSLLLLVSVALALRPAPPEEEDASVQREDLVPWAPDPDTVGSIQGEVRFFGAPPVPEVVSMQAEPTCAGQHTTPPLSEAVLVKDGKVQGAFVYIKRGLEGYQFEAPTEEVVIDQKGCLYRPRVSGVQIGQPLTFLNSDGTNHNVHTLPRRNQSSNFAMPSAGMRTTRTFSRPEVMMKTKCDIHPWMAAYIGIIPHHFFQVTGPDGRFSLEGLAPGEYVVEVWHEVFGTRIAKVSLDAKGTRDINFTFGK